MIEWKSRHFQHMDLVWKVAKYDTTFLSHLRQQTNFTRKRDTPRRRARMGTMSKLCPLLHTFEMFTPAFYSVIFWSFCNFLIFSIREHFLHRKALNNDCLGSTCKTGKCHFRLLKGRDFSKFFWTLRANRLFLLILSIYINIWKWLTWWIILND